MDLYLLGKQLLDLTIEQLTALGTVVPERQYVAPGADVAFDCEQLTVRLTRVISNFQGADTPYPMVTHMKQRKTAEYFVTLVRCIPTMHEDGTPPSASELNGASNITMNDAMNLRIALENIEHAHTLVQRNVPTTVGQLQTLGPLGGMVANDMMFSVEIVSNPAGWVG
jgi:hypothetical protein